MRDNWLARRRSAPADAPARRRGLERLGVTALAGRTVGQLSHGQRQWVELGTVLAREPDLILLDEPAAGMTDEEVARHRRADPRDQPDPRPRRRRARHAVHQMIARTVTVFHQGAVLMEGTVDGCWTTTRSATSISASRWRRAC